MKVESEEITVVYPDTGPNANKSLKVYGIDIDLSGLYFDDQRAADLTALRIREAVESSIPFSVEV